MDFDDNGFDDNGFDDSPQIELPWRRSAPSQCPCFFYYLSLIILCL